ncbi:MAG: FtsW/RodA/SpoVE family cell cycle protein [Chloroflexota bacterium]
MTIFSLNTSTKSIHLFGRPLGRSGRVAMMLGLVSALFVFSNAISLSIVVEGRIAWFHLIGPLIWLIGYIITIGLLAYLKPKFDPYILAVLMLLTGWGILMVDRLAVNFLSRQIAWVILGTAVILVITLLPKNLNWLRRYRYTLLIIGIFLLGTTFIFGVNPSGATTANYWLQLPFSIPVFFQPSELLKLLLVIFLASFFDEQTLLNRQNNILNLLAPITVMGGFCMLMLVWQRDLGAATLFFLLFLSLFYVATGRKLYLLAGFCLLIVAGIFAYFWFDVVALRVDAWVNPWPDADGRAFQIVQSLYAFASGGIFGQGIGQGFPGYIPVVHSDFVFAAIGEEWGLIGSLTVLFCFVLLMHRGLMIGLRAKRPFHRYLATGITILISIQAILIMGGVTKLLPLTGVTLPFVSYGGSSMLVSHMMLGLLLYLSCHAQEAGHMAVPLTKAQKHLRQLHIILLSTFALIGLSLLYWSVAQAGTILIRDDNPRQVETALRVQRGSIVDRNGVLLAETTGEGNLLTREYPLPNIGPAVGYYSFRHGTAGIEDGYNLSLSQAPYSQFFRFWNESILHRPAVGNNIRLTLDAENQQLAHRLMAEQSGGLILFQLDKEENLAEILSMVSLPSHDPNLLDDQFDALIEDENAPLLNRTTQGLYQPGMILQPFILATAVNQNSVVINQPVPNATLPVTLDKEILQCQETRSDIDSWEAVLHGRCPNPMHQLGHQLNTMGIEQTYAFFGLTQSIALPIPLETTTVSEIESPALAAIGQDTLTLTPLTLGRAWMMLMNNGRLPKMQIVLQAQHSDGTWFDIPTPAIEETESPNLVDMTAVQERLPQTEDQVVEFSGTAVSGESQRDSWYLGTKTINNLDYFVVLILEGNQTVAEAEKIGRALLKGIEG